MSRMGLRATEIPTVRLTATTSYVDRPFATDRACSYPTGGTRGRPSQSGSSGAGLACPPWMEEVENDGDVPIVRKCRSSTPYRFRGYAPRRRVPGRSPKQPLTNSFTHYLCTSAETVPSSRSWNRSTRPSCSRIIPSRPAPSRASSPTSTTTQHGSRSVFTRAPSWSSAATTRYLRPLTRLGVVGVGVDLFAQYRRDGPG